MPSNKDFRASLGLPEKLEKSLFQDSYDYIVKTRIQIF